MTVDEQRIAADARRLWESETPYLIGVRHHSPAIAAVVPALLDAFRPDVILLELPAELEPWIEWLGHPDTVTPVALAAVERKGSGLSFYPFADFSPELAVIRWARRHRVTVRAADLPWAAPDWHATSKGGVGPTTETVIPRLWRGVGADGPDEFWDRAVEVAAPGSTPDAVRRAALTVGLALRLATPEVSEIDLAREAWMRQQLAGIEGRVAAIVGSFHAAALLEPPAATAGSSRKAAARDVVTSMIPYTFPLLDSRSGYPAGIRDPEWQQRVVAGAQPDEIAEGARAFAVAVVAELRAAGHAAGTVDATEVARVALDLAHLRRLPAPGRREFVEACASVLAQGEPVGRGRAVARAMSRVLIGDRRGQLAPGTPRSGLGPHVEGLLADLRLPGPNDESADMRLDPLRSDLDRRRHVALMRLVACAVPYADLLEGAGVGIETLTQHWRLEWHPATSALIDLAGLHGVTLEQAAEGKLRFDWAHASEDGAVPPPRHLEGLRLASECGLAGLTEERIRLLEGPFIDAASLTHLLGALDELERVGHGHVPGFTPTAELGGLIDGRIAPLLLERAVQRVEGLRGSDRLEDAAALGALVRRLDRDREGSGSARLDWALASMANDGSPLMQGAASVVRVLSGVIGAARYGELLASWLDLATAEGSRRDLAARLNGTVVVAAPFLETAGAILRALAERVDALADEAFIGRLPALRAGFDPLSTAGRGRFLEAVFDAIGLSASKDLALEASAETIAEWASADAAGRAAVEAMGISVGRVDASTGAAAPATGGVSAPPPGFPTTNNRIATADRWRLILGVSPEDADPELTPIVRALDELYGGRGEGSRTTLGSGPGAGGGSGDGGFPTAREWGEALERIFGERIRDEVLGRAAEQGRSDVVESLNPETVTPSVELLEQMLSLAGSLPEASMGHFRTLVGRMVAQLVAELATRIRPALTGQRLGRTTRRRGGPLHLRRTVSANLGSARARSDGGFTIVPDRPYFHAKGRRAFDWRVVICVDVSGSMEASVVYSALVAAILSGLPAVETNFLAFSDKVVDLSKRVSDPLALLLEIRVGGGTNIGAALRHAKTLVTVPARTIVLVVSDFEEGVSTGELVAEVRAMAASGARLLGLAALDDKGAARYDAGVAALLVDAGMPIAALTPDALARWVGDQIHGR